MRATRRCWPGPSRPSCCAPRGCAPTPRSCRRTWPIRPTPGCWPGRFAGSPRPGGGSRPPAARSAPAAAIAAGRPGTGRTPSPPSCGCAAPPTVRRRRPRCGGSPANSPRWPSGPPPTPNGCWPTPAGRCAAPTRRPPAARARARRTRPRAGGGGGCRGGEATAAGGGRRGGWQRAVDDLAELLSAPRTIAAQTHQRLAGTPPDGATRRVSLHDPAARPIAKGRLGRPVEFGYKGQVLDNDDGVVLDHTLDEGNPPDAPQLAPAVARVIARTGHIPRAVTADRGYGEARVETDLHDLGVRTVVIPRKGRPGKARQTAEHRPAFRKIVKWRTGRRS